MEWGGGQNEYVDRNKTGGLRVDVRIESPGLCTKDID